MAAGSHGIRVRVGEFEQGRAGSRMRLGQDDKVDILREDDQEIGGDWVNYDVGCSEGMM